MVTVCMTFRCASGMVSVHMYSTVLGCMSGIVMGSMTLWWLHSGHGFHAVQKALGPS